MGHTVSNRVRIKVRLRLYRLCQWFKKHISQLQVVTKNVTVTCKWSAKVISVIELSTYGILYLMLSLLTVLINI